MSVFYRLIFPEKNDRKKACQEYRTLCVAYPHVTSFFQRHICEKPLTVPKTIDSTIIFPIAYCRLINSDFAFPYG